MAILLKEPSPKSFFEDYVVCSTPCVLKGALKSWGWTCLEWDRSFLQQWDHEDVTAAPLRVPQPSSPDVYYDPVDGVPNRMGARAYWDKWIEASVEWDPDRVETTPGVMIKDRVLAVAGDRHRMPVRGFLKYLGDEETSREVESRDGVTFYADGAGNLEHSFSFLRDHAAAHHGWCLPSVADGILLLKRVDLWLGRRSISRLHFDNLDNLFGQAVGAKRFRLIHPKYSKYIVQSRLRKAWYGYDHPGQFTRGPDGFRGPEHDETVINYTVLDIDNPDLDEYVIISPATLAMAPSR